MKAARKRFAVIIMFKSPRKTHRRYSRFCKCWLFDRKYSVYQRNTLLALWSICPEIVEISRRMLFRNSCRVYIFVLEAFLLNLPPKSSQDVKSRECRGQRPRVSARPRKLYRSVSKLCLSVIISCTMNNSVFCW